jgi:hypothetical protein
MTKDLVQLGKLGQARSDSMSCAVLCYAVLCCAVLLLPSLAHSSTDSSVMSCLFSAYHLGVYTYKDDVDELAAAPPHGAKTKLETLHRIFTSSTKSEIMVDGIMYKGLDYSFAHATIVVRAQTFGVSLSLLLPRCRGFDKGRNGSCV